MKYCLYNGVKLAELPDYDAEKYPYLYMRWERDRYSYNGTRKYSKVVLYCMSHPLVKGSIDTVTDEPLYPDINYGNYYFNHDAGSDYVSVSVYSVSNLSEAWTHHTEVNYATYSCDIANIIWSNSYVYTAEGALYSPSTDPIPTGGNEKLAHLLGWMTGRLARRLNGANDTIDAELIDGVLYIKNANASLTDGVLEVW